MPRHDSYEESLRRLLALTGRGVQPGLGRIRTVLRRLEHPERSYPSVLVGGTNGKGSVATMVARAARAEGLKVGLFTSPHLHRLTERIRVDGREISRAAVARTLRRVEEAAAGSRPVALTFFETLTAMAAEHFAEIGVDLAVFEVGLGGRLDATRLVDAKVVVITTVAMDHERILGRSLSRIADEKFALARRGAVVVAGPLRADLGRRLDALCRKLRAPSWRFGEHIRIARGPRPGTFDYLGPGGPLSSLRQPLAGDHQDRNAALAVAAVAGLRRRGIQIGERAVRRGLATVRWPGRFERALGGRVVFDVAHNPAAIAVVRRQLEPLVLERRPLVMVLGFMRDKNITAMARALTPLADELILTAPELGRAIPPRELSRMVPGRPIEGIPRAADEALRRAGPDGLVVFTGSSFVVAEARAHVLGVRPVDPSVPM